MTDKELKTEFIILHGKLFAIMQALTMLAEKETSAASAFEKRLQDVADNHAKLLLNALEHQDLDDKN